MLFIIIKGLHFVRKINGTTLFILQNSSSDIFKYYEWYPHMADGSKWMKTFGVDDLRPDKFCHIVLLGAHVETEDYR